MGKGKERDRRYDIRWPSLMLAQASSYTDGETQAQKRKQDLLKATQAVIDWDPEPASPISHWVLVYVI